MEAHPSHELAFSATLTSRQRRLAGRLEGFGDIVFGFAVAQCALQLPSTNGHVDFSQPVALAIYFATFALVASLWLIFHRLMSGTYVPSGIDLFLAFAYLALVSLIPYAMYAISHTTSTFDNGNSEIAAPLTLARARSAVAAYTGLYATMTFLASILSVRNLRRGYAYLSDEDRRLSWLSFMRQAILCVMMLGALVIDRLLEPSWAGFELLFIFPAIRIGRMLFPRAPAGAFKATLAVDRPAT
jgi:uncharacterized membrane protein